MEINTLRVPDYTLVDARIGYDLAKVGLKGLDVSLNANNLLDDQVYQHASFLSTIPQVGRNFSVGVNFSF